MLKLQLIICSVILSLGISTVFADNLDLRGANFGMGKAQIAALKPGILVDDVASETDSILFYKLNEPVYGFNGAEATYKFTDEWETINDGVPADKLYYVIYKLKYYNDNERTQSSIDFERLFADLKSCYGEPVWGLRQINDNLAAYENGLWVKSERAVELANMVILGWVDGPVVHETPLHMAVWQSADADYLIALGGMAYDGFSDLKLEFMVKRDGVIWQSWQKEAKE